MYDEIVVPALLYSSEVWVASAGDRRSMEVMEMKCMKAMCRVSIIDSVELEMKMYVY
jgi:hypothetical protein